MLTTDTQIDWLDALGALAPETRSDCVFTDPCAVVADNMLTLTDGMKEFVARFTTLLARPINRWVNPSSDFADERFGQKFGEKILIHHATSNEALTKEAFEHTLVSVMNDCNHNAQMAPRGNPGHDICALGQSFSLKTQADKSIVDTQIHISKFMELGRGAWTNRLEDFEGLKAQFVAHTERYERILTLRRLKSKQHHRYELVEIPKDVLLDALSNDVVISHASTHAAKPASITAQDHYGNTIVKLYFDGGGERKLQVQQLQKDYCIVHATWDTLKQK